MIDVAVRIDDGDDRFLAHVLEEQIDGGFGRFGGNQRVNHDVPGIAHDEADI